MMLVFYARIYIDAERSHHGNCFSDVLWSEAASENYGTADLFDDGLADRPIMGHPCPTQTTLGLGVEEERIHVFRNLFGSRYGLRPHDVYCLDELDASWQLGAQDLEILGGCGSVHLHSIHANLLADSQNPGQVETMSYEHGRHKGRQASNELTGRRLVRLIVGLVVEPNQEAECIGA